MSHTTIGRRIGRDARTLVAAGMLAGGLALAPAAAGAGTGADAQQISRATVPPRDGAEADTEAEPSVAVDPTNPAVIVAAFQIDRFPNGAALAIGYAWSHDGGHTWRDGVLPGITHATGGTDARVSDPVVAFGPDGTVYVASIGSSAVGCGDRVLVSRSTDHGMTFGAPGVVANDVCPRFADKDWIAVDTSATSPHRGRVYVFWDETQVPPPALVFPTVVRTSDDGGRTWSSRAFVTSFHTDTISSQPVIAADGTVVDVLVEFAHDETQASVIAVRSSDGGRTWSAPVHVQDAVPFFEPDVRAGDFPAAAIDRSTGRIDVVVEDSRHRADGLNDIVVDESRDGGRSWSTVGRANGDASTSGIDHFTPEVAAHGGVVAVTYRTRDRNGTPSGFVGSEAVVSHDGGEHFGAPVTLGPPSDLQLAAVAPVPFFGDYSGLAVAGDGFVAVWDASPDASGAPGPQHQTTWAATFAS